MNRCVPLAMVMCAALALPACKKDADADNTAPPAVSEAVLPAGEPPEVAPAPEPAAAQPAPPAQAVPLMPLQTDGAAVPLIDGEAAAQANATSPAPTPHANAIAALPDTLKFKGEAIDPLCFTQTWEQDDANTVIDLTDCEDPQAVRTTDSAYQPSPGSYGTAYRPADANPENMPGAAVIEYKYLGDIGTDHAVLLTESGGGTGMFTSLYLLKREGDALRVSRTVAGGDRCNNGIHSAAVDNGALAYEVNLTPAALYTLSGGDNTLEVPGGPVKDCAVCCYATATYQGETLVGITFNPEISAALNPAEDGTNGCFDGIVNNYLNAGELRLPVAGMKNFGTDVYNACFAPSTNAAP